MTVFTSFFFLAMMTIQALTSLYSSLSMPIQIRMTIRAQHLILFKVNAVTEINTEYIYIDRFLTVMAILAFGWY
jgi:hypothetical protein